MKNIKTTVALAGLITMGAVVLSQPAFAETKTTEATVSILEGDLSFTVPDKMEFKPLRVSSANQSTEINEGNVAVKDYRDSATDGWSISAKATGTLLDSGIQIEMNPTVLTNVDLVTKGGKMQITETASNVAKISGTNISKTTAFITNFKPNTQLNVPGDHKKGDYTAIITWDMYVGPAV